jgi:hypothetical protein
VNTIDVRMDTVEAGEELQGPRFELVGNSAGDTVVLAAAAIPPAVASLLLNPSRGHRAVFRFRWFCRQPSRVVGIRVVGTSRPYWKAVAPALKSEQGDSINVKWEFCA